MLLALPFLSFFLNLCRFFSPFFLLFACALFTLFDVCFLFIFLFVVHGKKKIIYWFFCAPSFVFFLSVNIPGVVVWLTFVFVVVVAVYVVVSVIWKIILYPFLFNIFMFSFCLSIFILFYYYYFELLNENTPEISVYCSHLKLIQHITEQNSRSEKLKSIFNFFHVGSVCAVCVYAKGIEATVTFSYG